MNITLADYYLFPIYLFVIYAVARIVRDRYYAEGHPFRSYFMPALAARIGGALAIGMIYQYYYGDGDTFNFFYHSKVINGALDTSFGTWLRLMLHRADDSDINDLAIKSTMFWYDDVPAYTVSRIGALIGLISFTKYLIINLWISVLSFSGAWKLFTLYARQYPGRIKPIAFATLFIPSVLMWGSGLFKDTICITCICWVAACVHSLFEERKFKISTVVILVVAIYVTYEIRAYLLFSFIPLLLFKTALEYKKRIGKRISGSLITILFIPFAYFVGLWAYRHVAAEITSFSIENVVKKVVVQKDYLLRVSLDSDGSAYDLGEFDPTLSGLLSKTVPAINVALFRPYPWESRQNVLIFLTSLESFAFLLLTAYTLLSQNPFRLLKRIFTDNNLIFCIAFTLIFGFFSGISSFNFGALSRYRIPCLPFFMLALAILSMPEEATKKSLPAEGEV